MPRRPQATTSMTPSPGPRTSPRPEGVRLRTTERSGARALLSAAAVRERCSLMLEAARAGRLGHFTAADQRLCTVADYVAETVRTNYPALRVPFHSRWRHFVVAGE